MLIVTNMQIIVVIIGKTKRKYRLLRFDISFLFLCLYSEFRGWHSGVLFEIS